MADLEQIKARVKKLMAVANDGIATDGEINNAMNLAMKLIDQHQIDVAELKEKEHQPDNIEYGRVSMNYTTTRAVTWESNLAQAICKLFGSVSMYTDPNKQIFRINGVAQTDNNGEPIYTPMIQFFGPILEINEAKELYVDWLVSIGTMGVTRWGGCYRGPGAQYCDGFTRAIYNKVAQLNQSRQLISAKAPPQLSNNTTAITLTKRYEIIKEGAVDWLGKTHNVHLKKRQGSSGYKRDNSGAYSEGYSHGSKSNFSRNSGNHKLLG